MPTNQEKVSQLLDTIRSCSKIQLYKLWLLLRAMTIFTTSTTTWSPNVKKAVGRNSKTVAKKVGEWCKEHWKEILITVTIVIGAVLAIAMVTSVSKLANFGTSNQLLINIPRTCEFTSGLSGLFSLNGSIINWLKEKW